MNRKNTICIICASAMMFVWIFITVFLTGGRDISEFTKDDKTIFSVFIILEMLTLVFLVICLSKTKQSTVNAVKKTIDKRRSVIGVILFLVILASMCGGIILRKHFSFFPEGTLQAIAVTVFLLPVLCLAVSLISNAVYTNILNKRSFKENQAQWVSEREKAKEIIEKRASSLKRLVIISDIYSVFLAVCAIASAFLLGAFYDGRSPVPLLFVCLIVLTGAGLRIRLKKDDSFLNTDKRYVSKEQYPTLYSLAEKAAKETGYPAEIRISLLNDFNAGVFIINGTVSIQLGVLLLNALSEDETYCVLLHELSHIKNEVGHKKIHLFKEYLDDNTASISRYFFIFIDRYFYMQYELYSYAEAIIRESNADKAMELFGDNRIAASALVKLKYHDLYEWERGTYDEPCDAEKEEYDTDLLEKESLSFKASVMRNSEKWNALIKNEILSRAATHPTLKMRLEALNVNEPVALFQESSREYISECKNATEYVSLLLANEDKASYEEYRKRCYLEPKKLIDDWEAKGKPIDKTEYRDIVSALRYLNRNTEALQVCEKAIELFDDAGRYYALYIKGCFLLHSFDESGIDLIYKAIEINNNYLNEGLDIIGQFCCLTGKEDQLAIYRERALESIEKNRIFDETSILRKNDRLSAESLPDGMLEDILYHITLEDSELIEKIYLVRKTVTEDFFTSAFIIKCVPNGDEDKINRLFNRAFNYLDTSSDWQFSLFDYDEVKDVKPESISGSCVYSRV